LEIVGGVGGGGGGMLAFIFPLPAPEERVETIIFTNYFFQIKK